MYNTFLALFVMCFIISKYIRPVHHKQTVNFPMASQLLPQEISIKSMCLKRDSNGAIALGLLILCFSVVNTEISMK